MDPSLLWRFLLPGYFLSIAIETPILVAGLSRVHAIRRRLFAGAWLTACTYPIVMLVLPIVMADAPRWAYLLVAETFAPVAECVLFAIAFHTGNDLPARSRLRDLLAIVMANLTSFGVGELSARLYGWSL